MLSEFITTNRTEIVKRCRLRVAARMAPRPTALELEHGIPLFLEQLARTLQSKLDGGSNNAGSTAATKHGGELMQMGFTVAQVVHDYGDACQTITALATERAIPISTPEFQALNLCLDEAIADAVTEFGRQREAAISAINVEDLGVFAHELRNLLATSILAYDMLKTGGIGIVGSTGSMLGRSLISLRNLVDRSLATVRLEAGIERSDRIDIRQLIEEAEVSALLEAKSRGHRLRTEIDDPRAVVDADGQILASIIANLVQNALKYTRPKSEVILRTVTTADRVRIEVEDECGGLPPGKSEQLFEPYRQASPDHSGLGLGLSICQGAHWRSAP